MGGDLPLVSVVLTHHGRPRMLRSALRSLKSQSYPKFEVIVVDDGSAGAEIIDELKSIEREISPLGWRLIRQDNRYLGAARNRGAKEAKGKYLIFMDDDNVAKPEEIETLVRAAERFGAIRVALNRLSDEAFFRTPSPERLLRQVSDGLAFPEPGQPLF